MRKKFNKQFKAQVALEAVKEELTLQELAEKYQMHPNQISVWKRTLLEQSSTLTAKIQIDRSKGASLVSTTAV